VNPYGIDDGPIETREIRRRERLEDPTATTEYNGGWYTAEEAAELRRRFEVRQGAYRKELRRNWEESEHGKLCMAFYEAFQTYRTHFANHPAAKSVPNGPELDCMHYPEHELFKEGLRAAEEHRWERDEKLRRNLEKAQRAARCRHNYLDGHQCGAPRVRGKSLCHMHERLEEAKSEKLDLGSMEDPNSIQVAIQRLQKAIIEGKLEPRQVAQLSYTIQLAAWNVSRMSMATGEE